MPKSLPNWENPNVDDLEVFSKIRIIAVDLDGTLIKTSNPNVWQNILWHMTNLAKGKLKLNIIIATGRTFYGARNTIDSLYNKKPLPIILYNGSLVIRNNDFKILYKKTIDINTLYQIINYSKSFLVSIFSYFYIDSDNSLFNDLNNQEYVLGWTNGTKIDQEFNKMDVLWEFDNKYLQNEPSAILISVNQENQIRVKELIEFLHTLSSISVTSSGLSYIEIRPTNSDKAKALSYVSDLLEIENQNVLAIGDNDNDSEMLAWAGIGVAINTATEKAQSVSDYICKHNVASGVLELLRLIKNSKRYFK